VISLVVAIAGEPGSGYAVRRWSAGSAGALEGQPWRPAEASRRSTVGVESMRIQLAALAAAAAADDAVEPRAPADKTGLRP
jgi:hypothetical protein